MPSFRDHSLTWLFIIAAACVGAVDLTRGRREVTLALLLSGFVYIAGAWGAVGRAHRLIRGAAVVGAPFAATLPFYMIASPPDELGAVLAVTTIVSLASFGVAAITTLLVRPFNSPSRSRSRSRWQISLSEILGWTIVVAIASVAVSRSDLPGDALEWIALEATHAIPFAAIIALFLAPRPHRDRAAVIASALLFGTWNVLAAAFFGGQYFTIWDIEEATVLLLLCFVALWILCVRLDESAVAARKLESGKPALKIHDESSDEE
jgi:hypothetical protein